MGAERLARLPPAVLADDDALFQRLQPIITQIIGMSRAVYDLYAPDLVTDRSGRTDIPGLYAAGECVGGVHGTESMPTCMLSWAATSGKLCGEQVAAALQQ